MSSDLPVYFSARESIDSSDNSKNSPQPIKLSQDEIRILRECNRESFYYRCVPLAVGAIGGTYLAVQRGLLKAHPKYGATFKMIGAGLLGWLIGKITYRRTCENKFLSLQNSQLADLIRKKRGLAPAGFSNDFAKPLETTTLSPDDSALHSSDKDYHSSFGSLNLDTDKNTPFTGLDRSFQDDSSQGEFDQTVPKTNVSYDELRRRNRGQSPELSSSGSSGLSPSKWNEGPSTPGRSRGSAFRDSPSSGTSKNTYGDVWEK